MVLDGSKLMELNQVLQIGEHSTDVKLETSIVGSRKVYKSGRSAAGDAVLLLSLYLVHLSKLYN